MVRLHGLSRLCQLSSLISLSIIGGLFTSCVSQKPPVPAFVSGQVLLAMAIHQEIPSYPQTSRANGVGGTAVADVVVGVDGKVKEIKVNRAPDAEIAQAVRIAVRKWTFES